MNSASAAPPPNQPATYARDSIFGFREVMRHWWSLDGPRPGAIWKYLLATALYNSLFAVVLSGIFFALNAKPGFWGHFWPTLLISNCIGFTIHFLIELTFSRIVPRFPALLKLPRIVLPTLLALFGMYIGYVISFALLGQNFTALILQYPRFAVGMLFCGLLGMCIWMLFMDSQSRRIRAEADAIRFEEEKQRLAAEARGAELRTLQAQIEPHFLFNTLANVLALIDYEPQKAKLMLDAFITHLRKSLGASRLTEATLGSELELVETYLKLLQIRMGHRLQFHIDCSHELKATRFSPLLLQPLVENAVKYGLEPKIEGGEVKIVATKLGDTVQIIVEDNGVGLSAISTARAGSGTGIANVRDRLASLYGPKATLVIEEKPAPLTGTRCIISLPHNPS